MRHLLKLSDLSREEITGLLNLADQLKYEHKNGIAPPVFKGQDACYDFSEGFDPYTRIV